MLLRQICSWSGAMSQPCTYASVRPKAAIDTGERGASGPAKCQGTGSGVKVQEQGQVLILATRLPCENAWIRIQDVSSYDGHRSG